MFDPLPVQAAWRFVDAVDGFEVACFEPGRLRGHSAAVENGRARAVRYDIRLDEHWRTRSAHVVADTAGGVRETVLVSDGAGHWTVDGASAPELDGLLDVDLEASACTNTLPVHRMASAMGELRDVPAAYVGAFDLSCRRLEQTYRRIDQHRYDYTADRGAFTAILEYDAAGLILTYPGIAERVT